MKLDIGRRILNVGYWTLDNRCWTIVVALCVLNACQSNPSEQPSLSDEKIARIMADISIADAATTGLNSYEKDSLMQAYFKQVFEMHGVTMETYEKDLRIIAKDLSHMEGIIKQADELLTEGGKQEGNTPNK